MLPNIPGLKHTSSNNFFIMAGPCAIEGEEIAFEIADKINAISNKLEIPWIFKGSYRKANRSKLDLFTGIGDALALGILSKVGKHYQVPTVTDIHETHEAELAAKYVDVLQIPAFLFRQTELLVAAANTGKFVNIKKGQFAAASAMSHASQKVMDSGSDKIMLTDRGNMFGYSDMVVDFRNITWMKAMGFPVIMDITHSLQQPNQSSGVTGGLPEMIETIAKAAIAVGADGLFIETHPRPNEAKSDGANMLQIDLLEPLMEKLLKIRKAIL